MSSDTRYEEDDEDAVDEDDDVMINPLNIPPHLIALSCFFPPPSRCDSTRRSVQSPKPLEILSNRSPEKLRLPQPTDLDLETFRCCWSSTSTRLSNLLVVVVVVLCGGLVVVLWGLV